MPAVSKAQQRFMGMVYATKKGDMTNPSPEVAQAAASMKKSDAKDFASTKHKKLPEKKRVEEKIDYADSKQMKRFADEKKKHKEQDNRMKFGKFSKRAEEARDRLRPGEVKRYDKAKGKWVSNKD
jgi:ribosomal protein S18